MSWGSALRCLFCNEPLPLIRKLTDGQFCSAAHRKAYWEEQQRLGYERLVNTNQFPVPARPLDSGHPQIAEPARQVPAYSAPDPVWEQTAVAADTANVATLVASDTAVHNTLAAAEDLALLAQTEAASPLTDDAVAIEQTAVEEAAPDATGFEDAACFAQAIAEVALQEALLIAEPTREEPTRTGTEIEAPAHSFALDSAPVAALPDNASPEDASSSDSIPERMEAPAAPSEVAVLEASMVLVEAPAASLEAPAALVEAPAASLEAPAALVEAPAASLDAPAALVEAPLSDVLFDAAALAVAEVAPDLTTQPQEPGPFETCTSVLAEPEPDTAPSLALEFDAADSDSPAFFAGDPVEYEPGGEPALPALNLTPAAACESILPVAGMVQFGRTPANSRAHRTPNPILVTRPAGAFVRPRRIQLGTWLPAGSMLPIEPGSGLSDRARPVHPDFAAQDFPLTAPQLPGGFVAPAASSGSPSADWLDQHVPAAEGLLSLPQFLVFEGSLAPRSASQENFEPKLRVRLPKPGSVSGNRLGIRRMKPLARFHPIYSGHVLARALPLVEVRFPAHVEQPRIDSTQNAPRLAGAVSLPSQLAAGSGEVRKPPFLGLAWPVEIPPIHPRLRLLPKRPEIAQPTDELRPKRRDLWKGVSLPAASGIRPWTPVVQFWHRAPRDLKLLAFALPLLAALAVHPSLPKVSITPADRPAPISGSAVTKVVGGKLTSVRQEIKNRAGVEFHDDFRSGLDNWNSKSDLHKTWSFDHAGFVRPGPLAIYSPTVPLTDYTFEFLGQLDRKSLSWAFRVQDFENYYAQRLVVLQPGPLPVVGLQTWAVIGGKPGPKREVVLPIVTRNEMLYRIKLDVRNENFTLSIQGQLVDFWSDGRLKSGGVGLFGARGQESRVRWVQVSHQYDALGRLCAYLAPYSIQSGDGSYEQ